MPINRSKSHLLSIKNVVLATMIVAAPWIAYAQPKGETSPAKHEIRLKGRTVTELTAAGVNRIQGNHYLLLSFDVLPSPEVLTEHGLLPVAYIDEHSVVVFRDQLNASSLQELQGLRIIDKIQAGDRLDRNVGEMVRSDAGTPDKKHALLLHFFSNVSDSEQAEIVREAGGIFEPRFYLPRSVKLVTLSRAAISNIAGDERVSWISLPDQVVLDGVRPFFYCEGARTSYGIQPNFATNGNGWDGAGLGSAALTYHFDNGTSDISGANENSAITFAAGEWAKYAVLSFSETSSNNANFSFDVGWYTGAHGDSDFDGPGGMVVAHAFYPPPVVGESLAGDIHFDDAESWSLSPAAGQYDLYTLAMHEMGHALGLAHSGDSSAIMRPNFATGILSHVLTTDDINGIRALYAPAGVAFSSPLYQGREELGTHWNLTVVRTGGSAAVSVNYTTQNGTANSGDYVFTSGTLSWGNGDMANKTISVPKVNDSAAENDEFFYVILSNPAGVALGTPSIAQVKIPCNDGYPCP